MQTAPVYPSALVAARDSLARAQDNLQHVEAFPSLFSALCEAIEILSSDAVLVSSLAGVGKQLADHLAILSTPVTQAVDDVLSSLRRANEATTRRIGINMLAEINAEDDLPPDPPDTTPELPSAARFFRDWVQGLTDYPVCPCDAAQLYAAYLRWCREADATPSARNGLSAHIAVQKG